MSRNKKIRGIIPGEIKEFLEEKYLQYNTPAFIEKDPVSIPHRYKKKQDIEISGFLTATIAWGRRDLILQSATRLMNIMHNSPYEFILNAGYDELIKASKFVHRTFNGNDCINYLISLRKIYCDYQSMEDIVAEGMLKNNSLIEGLSYLRGKFFETPHNCHSEKHFADIARGSAGKRIFMFLRIIKVAT